MHLPFPECLSPSGHDFFPVSSTSSLVVNHQPPESHPAFSCYALHDEDLTSQPYDPARSRKTSQVSFMPSLGSLPTAGASCCAGTAAGDLGKPLPQVMANTGRKGVRRRSTERSKTHRQSGAQCVTDLFLHPRCSRHSVWYLWLCSVTASCT